MKIYQVLDDCDTILCTTDRLKMLEALYKLYRKYEGKQMWFDVWENETK